MTVIISEGLTTGRHYVRLDVVFGKYCCTKYFGNFYYDQLDRKLDLICAHNGKKRSEITSVNLQKR